VVNSVLSAIGLALDAVGATFLVIGLFRPPRGTGPGYAYAPDDAARDAAFGFAGGTLLGIGFVLQSLLYLGVTAECSSSVTAFASGTALVLGTVYGLVAYEITHRLVFDRRRAYGLRKMHMDYPIDRRRGLWFWRPSDD